MALDTGIDFFDPDTYVEGIPHDTFARLRSEDPVHWHPHPDGGGFWALSRYEHIQQVNRDPETFSSWRRTALVGTVDDDLVENQRLMMLNMDPPAHTRLRKIVNKAFTPRRIRALSESLQQRARTIVADFATRGSGDFVDAVACELPLQAIADIMGVLQEERRYIFDLTNRLVGSEDPEYQGAPEEAMEAATEMYAYAQKMADLKRADPHDDIVTALLQAEVDGERLTDLEFNLFFMLLAVAGNETTRNAISHSMLALLEHPTERDKLVADPERMPAAVEEFLRWATPVMCFRRTATTDTQIGDQAIREGDGVLMFYISGNRDADAFDDPYRFDIDRDPNPHLQHQAFGAGGPHFCLGANLARAEMSIMFTELLPILPSAELAGPVDRLRSNFINGIKRLPLTWDPVDLSR